ncbi:TRAP transporter substrate-binding protein [Phreatobacter sp.]|uniref:TRAP transporter substrate-binding protein n=1 Tax=Phreatobacter sp. TaxID=1966341 RepID=UPI003F6FB798
MKIKGLIAAIAAIALTFAVTTADAQDRRVRLQVAGAFPSSTGLLGPTQQYLVNTLRAISGNSIDARFFEPGALVPAGQYLDAVANGSLDSAWTVGGFWTGKDITFALFASVPFGPEAGEYLAWMRHGGGNQLMEELYTKYGIGKVLLCGLISPEASGWFRRAINGPEDLRGLKMRFFGLGANVMQRLGVATQLLQAGEIFQALQLGTIDATEFSMPVMDLTLGFHQVAKFYYFPGWHQMSTLNTLIISKQKWAEFSDTQKRQIEVACDSTMLRQFAEGEAVQGAAMREIQSKGVEIRYWSKDMLDLFRKTWEQVAAELVNTNPEFKRAWESYTRFRAEYAIWKQHGYLRD